MSDPAPVPPRALRWLREPVVHFFALGALLFAARSFVGEGSRTIVITPGLRADLARRLEDQAGEKPDEAELREALRIWQRDEALYREALRRGLDRDDPGVRAALIGRMQALAALEVPDRVPTDADLDAWLSAHRDRYEVPMRLHFEFVAFAKRDANAEAERAAFERSLATGAEPASLGRPVAGGKLPVADLTRRLPGPLAERIPKLEVGVWERVDGTDDLWLARVKQRLSELPDPVELRRRLVSDWTVATRQAAIESVLDEAVKTYRIEERP